MTLCHVLTTCRSMAMHRVVAGCRMTRMAIGTIVVMIVIVPNMMAIYIECPAMIGMPPTRPVAPIPGRIPANPVGAPEPVINDRYIEVCGLDDIVCSVDVLVTDHLHNNLVVSIFLHIDGGYILKNVFCQNGLQQNQVFVAVCRFYNTQIINLAVAIQVEVGYMQLFAVEFLLKFFQISTLTEECSNGLEVQILRYVLVGGANRNRLVCTCRPSKGHYHGHEDKNGTCLHKRVIF